jgi:2-polyprenyl-3-methyl-5-hydroxy-6-metoxy-1,4-benzoquinol methylase
MRIGTVPENPIERAVSRLNLVPRPLLETQMAYTLARLVMLGTKLGVFEVLRDGDLSPEEVASRCGTHPAATGKLLFALAGSGYLEATEGRYGLTPVSRTWLLRESPKSLADKLLLQFYEWDLIARSEDYVRTGEPLHMHEEMDDEQWGLYQRGMRAMAAGFAAEGMRRMPIPKGARDMLDIGGSHGYYSAALCRRHDGLRAVVLDLPQAVAHAAPILAEEQMGDRVVHRAGNALTDDLGNEEYDLVTIVQLVHHFTEQQNRDLARKVARALRPGGVYAIVDAFRAESPKEAGQMPALLEFYFAMTSESGTWSVEEMTAWQRDAGLEPRRPIRFRTAPGGGTQAATKPG